MTRDEAIKRIQVASGETGDYQPPNWLVELLLAAEKEEEDRKQPKISLLDAGHVRLVDSMGGDLSIVRAARVSYNATWRAGANAQGDERLIRYLMDNGHTSPFEHVVLTFDVLAPIFVFRQWHRHRTWSYNEMSGRYTHLPFGAYVPSIQVLGGPNAANKQSRDTETAPFNKTAVQSILRDHATVCKRVYDQLEEMGLANELARLVLPVSTYSQMFATVDLHNLFNFIRLRSHEHAQYEIRVYSNAMLRLAMDVAPIACRAFLEHLSFDPLAEDNG